MAKTTRTTTTYRFELAHNDGITLQKVTKNDVIDGRGRDYRASSSSVDDIITLTPAEVALVIETGADCLGYVLRDVQIEKGYTVLTKHGEEQD